MVTWEVQNSIVDNDYEVVEIYVAVGEARWVDLGCVN